MIWRQGASFVDIPDGGNFKGKKMYTFLLSKIGSYQKIGILKVKYFVLQNCVVSAVSAPLELLSLNTSDFNAVRSVKLISPVS